MAPVTLREAKRIVIKIGSALLVDTSSHTLKQAWLESLIYDIADLKAKGKDVLIVSSGSIALGRHILGYDAQLSLEKAQAAAATGQIKLAQAYETALEPHKLKAAQILLTLEDTKNRRRYLNARATLNALLSANVVPIINENDTVATDEIRFGDNDRLAAQVGAMVGADILFLLSDVDGLYSANPRDDKSAVRFDSITKITTDIEKMAGDTGTGLSRGGMKTKIMAAKTSLQAGMSMVIMKGDVFYPLNALIKGAPATWFHADKYGAGQRARKDWIAALKPMGVLTIDEGAFTALQTGKSLLPVGLKSVSGEFERGDPVSIETMSGESIAIGLSGYSSHETQLIMGAKTADIKHLIGYPARAALIHRDDMVISE